MKNDNIKEIFSCYPDAKELYQDINGQIWTDKGTAELQSKGGKVTTLKRSDYFKEKTIKEDTK